MAARVILITGASGGIAQEIIKRLTREDHVILLGRQESKLQDLYRHVPNKTCIELDITQTDSLSPVIEQIYQQHGAIDILINNAGFGTFKTFDAYAIDEIEEMFEVNTLATIHLSRLIGQQMAKRGSGHIITIASMAGLMASAKATIYAATKFAVIGFSNALRLELAAHQVYVTTVNTGPVATPFFDKADPSGQYLKSVEAFSLKPDHVAKKIIKIMGKNKRELNLPFALNIAHKLYSLFPWMGDFLARTLFHYK